MGDRPAATIPDRIREVIVQTKKGAILSALFDKKSPAIDAEIDAFASELKKLHAKYPKFVVAESVKAGTLEIDVFPARDTAQKQQDAIPTAKMRAMTPEEALASVAKAVTPAVKPVKPAGLAPPKTKKKR